MSIRDPDRLVKQNKWGGGGARRRGLKSRDTVSLSKRTNGPDTIFLQGEPLNVAVYVLRVDNHLVQYFPTGNRYKKHVVNMFV